MPTIAQLSQRNPSVDVDELADLRALYSGGKAFRRRLGTFLPKRPHEPSSFYEIRSREAVYRNYIAPIIDHFSSMLFMSRPVAVAKDEDGEPVTDTDEFYNRFRDDCDRSGEDVDAVLKSILTDAMVVRHGWVRLHHASDDGPEPQTRAEFEARSLGDCWLQTVRHEDVLDWDLDESGRLAWVLTHRIEARRGSLSEGHETIIETWEHLLPDVADTYRIQYKRGEKPAPETDVPRVASVPHRFGAVPMVCMALHEGLWIAHRLESPQLAHFRLSNAQQWGMFMTCYAQPVYKLRDMDNIPTMGANWGIMIGAEESVEWIAPPSSPYEALGRAITEHKDELFRIAQNLALGVENNAASVGRSAESKMADAQATKVALIAYSRVVKETMERIYDLVSAARGDDYEWSIEGLDDFAAADIGSLVDVLGAVETSGGIPSKTFNVEMKSRIAEALLPDVSQQTKQMIRNEIRAGVDDEETREEQLIEIARGIGAGAEGRPEEDRRGGSAVAPPPPPQRRPGFARGQVGGRAS
jgi:hypothetical protein